MHIRRPEDESFGDEDNSNQYESRTELSESTNETAQNSAVGFWKGLRATRREAPGRFWRWGVAAGSRERGVGEGVDYHLCTRSFSKVEYSNSFAPRGRSKLVLSIKLKDIVIFH